MQIRVYTLFMLLIFCDGIKALDKYGKPTDSIQKRSFNDVQLRSATVSASSVKRVRETAYNAIAIDTRELKNSTKTLADALVKAPGIKLRETGGVGSDLQLMMDGFSGKHIKVFIDGVPQEGVGSAFSLSNIPAGFAERIEVYKGVVPVGFGTDALGGVVNVITGKQRRGWNLDASYSFGSFNTHRTHATFGQSLANGLTYELSAFQNYSDNDYMVDAAVEDFETGRIERNKKERVRRFNDNYHNEAVAAKVGVVGKPWADRLMLGFNYAHEYKEMQTGVRQETVFGEKHRHGQSFMPSLEWRKRNLWLHGLSANATVNYNRNFRTNVDTASHKYNWRGETKLLNSPGEQSYQHSRANNDNWNTTLRVDYQPSREHTITLSHVFNAFHRSNTSLLAKVEQEDAIAKRTIKNISGLSYRWMPAKSWNVTAFGKFYGLKVQGPVAVDANASNFVRDKRHHRNIGYGAAGTCFLPVEGLQVKASYEKAYRLPTIEEMFGDEDLEQGSTSIRPEESHNVNVSLSYAQRFAKHHVFAEAGFILRDTRDYIQRNITDLSGGKQAATYINYGKVMTKGYNVSLRYNYDRWLSVGGNFTQMNVRDNMKTMIGTTVPNLLYKDRMPNLPYLFADFDVALHWHDFLHEGNRLTLNYDAFYTHEFTFYASRIGANNKDFLVPDQWSHNVALTYSFLHNKLHLALECRNLADAKLYDNFSLQKPGRAFYAKLRIHLSGK